MDEPRAPWQNFYDDYTVPMHIEYPDISMYEFVKRAADRFPMMVSLDYMGKEVTYKELIKNIDHVASCLYRMGIRRGDHVLVCLPNIPQAIYTIYALNKIGAVAVVTHPLSAKNELRYFIDECHCHLAFTFDSCVSKFVDIKDETVLERIIVASVKEDMTLANKIGYDLFVGRKDPVVPELPYITRWREFVNYEERDVVPKIDYHGDEPAMILYSGGTTGTPKGVVLSNLNLNATAMETIGISECIPCAFEKVYTDEFKNYLDDSYSVLAVMPIFHGFGFGVGVHTFLTFGGKSILVPKFTPDSFAKLIVKHKPNFIAGVPTLFEHMIRSKFIESADLSFLKGVFVGGDSLSPKTRELLDKFFTEHKSPVLVREGYGLTECVTVTCLTPKGQEEPGVIGIPVPDVYYKIVKQNTDTELAYGKYGEICISGPCVMLGYKNNPEETANALRTHKDGRVWLHTGDVGKMDKDGTISFKQRYKRIIITSGYNVYPQQIENILNSHPDVECSCVIAIPDEIMVSKVKACVLLKDGMYPRPELLIELYNLCKNSVAKYAVPREIVFVQEMPRTKLGKIDYMKMEEVQTELYLNEKQAEAEAEAAKIKEEELRPEKEKKESERSLKEWAKLQQERALRKEQEKLQREQEKLAAAKERERQKKLQARREERERLKREKEAEEARKAEAAAERARERAREAEEKRRLREREEAEIARERERLEMVRAKEQARLERLKEREAAERQRLIEKEKALIAREKERLAAVQAREQARLDREAERVRREKERETAIREREQERIRIEKERQAERVRIEKERQAERVRIEKERQAEKLKREKEKEAVIREREQERLRIEKEREAECLRIEKERQAEEDKRLKELERRRAREEAFRLELEAMRLKFEKERQAIIREREKLEATIERRRQKEKEKAWEAREAERLKHQQEREEAYRQREKERLAALRERDKERYQLEIQRQKEYEARMAEKEAARLEWEKERAKRKAKGLWRTVGDFDSGDNGLVYVQDSNEKEMSYAEFEKMMMEQAEDAHNERMKAREERIAAREKAREDREKAREEAHRQREEAREQRIAEREAARLERIEAREQRIAEREARREARIKARENGEPYWSTAMDFGTKDGLVYVETGYEGRLTKYQTVEEQRMKEAEFARREREKAREERQRAREEAHLQRQAEREAAQEARIKAREEAHRQMLEEREAIYLERLAEKEAIQRVREARKKDKANGTWTTANTFGYSGNGSDSINSKTRAKKASWKTVADFGTKDGLVYVADSNEKSISWEEFEERRYREYEKAMKEKKAKKATKATDLFGSPGGVNVSEPSKGQKKAVKKSSWKTVADFGTKDGLVYVADSNEKSISWKEFEERRYREAEQAAKEKKAEKEALRKTEKIERKPMKSVDLYGSPSGLKLDSEPVKSTEKAPRKVVKASSWKTVGDFKSNDGLVYVADSGEKTASWEEVEERRYKEAEQIRKKKDAERAARIKESEVAETKAPGPSAINTSDLYGSPSGLKLDDEPRRGSKKSSKKSARKSSWKSVNDFGHKDGLVYVDEEDDAPVRKSIKKTVAKKEVKKAEKKEKAPKEEVKKATKASDLFGSPAAPESKKGSKKVAKKSSWKSIGDFGHTEGLVYVDDEEDSPKRPSKKKTTKKKTRKSA